VREESAVGLALVLDALIVVREQVPFVRHSV